MAPLLSCQSLTKSYSSRPLFRGISLAIDERDRVGFIGPNGAGKSTLLKIMAGLVSPDEGEVTPRKGLVAAYVPQNEQFEPGTTIRQVLRASVPAHVEEYERDARVEILAAKMGFPDADALAETLSGGWRKRLSLAARLIVEPDLLLLDEPTNHLDLDGVLWLEELLNSSAFAFVVITHDRTFLQNVSNRIVELNPTYADGYLSVNGKYSDFLEAREQAIGAQLHQEQAIASKVRREIAWLQRGARARQTKQQARIKEAERLIDSLAEVKFRNAQNTAIDVDFSASGRKTKELLVVKNLSKKMANRTLFSDVNIILTPGTKLGLLGANGSGKTTLLRILEGKMPADTGSIKRADELRVVVFDQNREQLDQSKTLWQALCPSGDAVVFQGRSIHVATWAKKFLFRQDQLNMPISYLSGGEQARILIANLMLKPADILILDEPTNDLDIPSLEVLEDSLEEFAGSVVLVTHDRYMLDNVSNIILALDGTGGADYYADYVQWEANRPEPTEAAGQKEKPKEQKERAAQRPRRSLSTGEKRELAQIEQTIEAAEQKVAQLEAKMTDPKVAANHVKLQEIMHEIDVAKEAVHRLYERWQDLEERAKDA